ncbi:MAG: MEKHLA domain-containing protein [Bradyrhizobiaceae bacterium]|nr:MAG: MEKHLA domain-containing protein [Bradyrhizobiaceae bacterium]
MTRPETKADDEELFELITGSFKRLTGKPLAGAAQGPRWLYRDAPYVVLAHERSPDPCFIYANRAAQACFGYSWDEFIGMPSRLSAEAPERAERQRLLDAVARDGFIADYKGVRISKSGRRFWIGKATVWQLIDGEGRLHGQAATFSERKDV